VLFLYQVTAKAVRIELLGQLDRQIVGSPDGGLQICDMVGIAQNVDMLLLLFYKGVACHIADGYDDAVSARKQIFLSWDCVFG